MKVNIKTNNVPRVLMCWMDLTDKEKLEYDYVNDEDRYSPSFFRYKGSTYYLGNFIRVSESLPGWEGAQHHTMFSGVCVRYANEFESVVVGTFWS